MSLGKNIATLRKSIHYSQEKLAEKLNVTRQTISKWELDETSPDILQAKELAKIFKITLDELVENDTQNLLTEKLKNTENLVKKQTKLCKVILLTIYFLILISAILFGFYWFTKKDFTKKYQSEFICTLNEEVVQVEIIKKDDGTYALESLQNGVYEELNAGDNLEEAFRSANTFKKAFITLGGVCQ